MIKEISIWCVVILLSVFSILYVGYNLFVNGAVNNIIDTEYSTTNTQIEFERSYIQKEDSQPKTTIVPGIIPSNIPPGG